MMMTKRPSSIRILIVGLGNYNLSLTRHSVGQLVLESLNRLLNQIHQNTISKSSSFSKGFNDQALRINLNDPITTFHSKSSSRGSRFFQIISDRSKNRSDGQGSSVDLKFSKNHSGWIAQHRFIIRSIKTDVSPRSKSSSPSLRVESGVEDDEDRREVLIELFKPKALMNICGPIVSQLYLDKHQACNKEWMGRASDGLRLKTERMMVLIHDELDLRPMKIKLKVPPGSMKTNGHNGLKSVFSSLRSRRMDERTLSSELRRIYCLKIGIDDEVRKIRDNEQVSRWVLGNLSTEEILAYGWKREDYREVLRLAGSHLDDELGAKRTRPLLEVWSNVLKVIIGS
ncbi:expressed protein [Phakopsora pachyrhizi]|uniref:Expressed protein n=1 Tax=Phakopsora pachyrhizi TaxID=170000 RepID=A0AAV0BRE2_PHAPC|nr:expressed protein [Phakopsora pachyrhizi]